MAGDDIQGLLAAVDRGDEGALARLVDAMYGELRALAMRHLRSERRDHTLQPTALVHEAWLKLVDQENRSFANRSHFLAVASMSMRRVLVHHARRRRAEKRGGGMARETVCDPAAPDDPARDVDLLALDEALGELGGRDGRAARIVELRYFGGLSMDEIAGVVGMKKRSLEREWRLIRAWLKRRLEGGDRAAQGGGGP